LLDEPTYRSQSELSDDCAIAKARGIEDLAVFDLGGMLRRGPVDTWLDSIVVERSAARVSSMTARAALAVVGTKTASLALETAGRLLIRTKD
jgi:hypothetical protein